MPRLALRRGPGVDHVPVHHHRPEAGPVEPLGEHGAELGVYSSPGDDGVQRRGLLGGRSRLAERDPDEGAGALALVHGGGRVERLQPGPDAPGVGVQRGDEHLVALALVEHEVAGGAREDAQSDRQGAAPGQVPERHRALEVLRKVLADDGDELLHLVVEGARRTSGLHRAPVGGVRHSPRQGAGIVRPPADDRARPFAVEVRGAERPRPPGVVHAQEGDDHGRGGGLEGGDELLLGGLDGDGRELAVGHLPQGVRGAGEGGAFGRPPGGQQPDQGEESRGDGATGGALGGVVGRNQHLAPALRRGGQDAGEDAAHEGRPGVGGGAALGDGGGLRPAGRCPDLRNLETGCSL